MLKNFQLLSIHPVATTVFHSFLELTLPCVGRSARQLMAHEHHLLASSWFATTVMVRSDDKSTSVNYGLVFVVR